MNDCCIATIVLGALFGGWSIKLCLGRDTSPINVHTTSDIVIVNTAQPRQTTV